MWCRDGEERPRESHISSNVAGEGIQNNASSKALAWRAETVPRCPCGRRAGGAQLQPYVMWRLDGQLCGSACSSSCASALQRSLRVAEKQRPKATHVRAAARASQRSSRGYLCHQRLLIARSLVTSRGDRELHLIDVATCNSQQSEDSPAQERSSVVLSHRLTRRSRSHAAIVISTLSRHVKFAIRSGASVRTASNSSGCQYVKLKRPTIFYDSEKIVESEYNF